MTDHIIYPYNDEGNIALITPSGALSKEETARKDVPAGKPYLFVTDADLPNDPQELWEADFSTPDGHGIGAEAWFAEQAAKEEPTP